MSLKETVDRLRSQRELRITQANKAFAERQEQERLSREQKDRQRQALLEENKKKFYQTGIGPLIEEVVGVLREHDSGVRVAVREETIYIPDRLKGERHSEEGVGIFAETRGENEGISIGLATTNFTTFYLRCGESYHDSVKSFNIRNKDFLKQMESSLAEYLDSPPFVLHPDRPSLGWHYEPRKTGGDALP